MMNNSLECNQVNIIGFDDRSLFKGIAAEDERILINFRGAFVDVTVIKKREVVMHQLFNENTVKIIKTLATLENE